MFSLLQLLGLACGHTDGMPQHGWRTTDGFVLRGHVHLDGSWKAIHWSSAWWAESCPPCRWPNTPAGERSTDAGGGDRNVLQAHGLRRSERLQYHPVVSASRRPSHRHCPHLPKSESHWPSTERSGCTRRSSRGGVPGLQALAFGLRIRCYPARCGDDPTGVRCWIHWCLAAARPEKAGTHAVLADLHGWPCGWVLQLRVQEPRAMPEEQPGKPWASWKIRGKSGT